MAPLMRYILLLVALVFLALTPVHCDSFDSKIKTLENQLEIAVQELRFVDAHKLNEEINALKAKQAAAPAPSAPSGGGNVAELRKQLNDLEAKLESAVKNMQFMEAHELDNKVKAMKDKIAQAEKAAASAPSSGAANPALLKQIAEVEAKLEAAIKNMQFIEAHQFDTQLKQLKAQLGGSGDNGKAERQKQIDALQKKLDGAVAEMRFVEAHEFKTQIDQLMAGM
eukprot:TRINITY_DN19222_c0_g1::TRINITY_DN19222_c0_g1_i1::g.2206::m.2206 TRINITY_DN19222_c0_g1::TRINITY_DN19222_c0_g1_i1::g.2206  ORF type:complete len:238 (+),score=77.32,UVR/PF02151.14/0.0016,UVR/PF02151.14/0.055,UVR/PF02151.14/0.42,UVR/PF02151.14/0.013,Laminin_II/PF06009.7/0.013,Laminin_II/PF06009.7/3.3e+02,Apolipoprotein/PF01442.13/0.46,Baculo_PEP_C/PF04513.7/37,Baculo_PEP_C/PF04513.7/0.9,Baculo_PEP_C/PF04513.7/16,AAA_13/PF13166.1/0.097,ABC_membrane_3/PF13748.1/0.16,K-box/PF01486.12/1.6,K-box/PF01486